MPLHDWSRVPVELFHHFHRNWAVEIARVLNGGGLPEGISALLERRSATAQARGVLNRGPSNRIALKRNLHRTIAAIEIVSPEYTESRGALRQFVEAMADFLHAGVHVLAIDVFPPTRQDPSGIHKAIWDELVEQEFTLPEAKNRVLASYAAGRECTAYVEPVAVGEKLPDMPLFLTSDHYVPVPLESSYQTAWSASPEVLRTIVETGVIPEADAES